jgi:hypothetical protein
LLTPASWHFEPNEAFDLILFLNAVSNDPFYNQYYSDVKEKWVAKLGESGASLIHEVRSIISMSKLCSELSRLKIKTLDDIIRFFEDATSVHKSNLHTLLPHREVFFQCFQLLKVIELDKTWESKVKPYLQDLAQQYHYVMTNAYPLDEMEKEVHMFLGTPQLICSTVFFATYIKPIAFQLPNGAMVMHPGPHGYMQLPKQLAKLCLHESLHGFPDSALAQERQDELKRSNVEFEKEYQELITKYRSGPEEYFVVGAEAYLSEKLNLRTYEECIVYLCSQNGEMPLSLAIYERLRNTSPEQESNWRGYGQLLHGQLMNLHGSIAQ